jgi:hypothetical protein
MWNVIIQDAILVFQSILAGIIGWVFCIILIDEGMIFGKWWNVLNKLPSWLSKPLGACEYCFSGQLAFWYYLYGYLHSYSLLAHIAFTCGTIFTVKIINTIVHGFERT